MNLFIIESRAAGRAAPGAIRRELEGVAEAAPGLEGRVAQEWRAPGGQAAAAWVSHDPERLGGIRYGCVDQGTLALYAGRPFAWTGEGQTDGSGPLDPRYYLESPERWWERLDGRYAVARWDRASERMEVFTDAMGAYPVYSAAASGALWVSNSPGALARVAGDRGLSTEVLAGFFSIGSSPSGHPVWRNVRRVGRGTRLSLKGDAASETQGLLPVGRIGKMFSAGFSAPEAARDIAASAGALADWPGRPSQVAVTGGKDSRMSFAGALRAGVDFTGSTKAFPGQDDYPDTPDVVVARRLCQAAGVPHEVLRWEGARHPLADPDRAVRILGVAGPGTVSLGDSFELPVGSPADRLPLVHGGQGAESARAFFGAGEGPTGDELGDRLLGILMPSYPPPIAGREGQAAVRSWFRAWVRDQEQGGVPPTEVPTVFHVLVRLGTWAAPGLASRDVGLDTTAPMWAARVLQHQVGLSAEERRQAVFYPRVLEHLSPDVAHLPYEASKRTTRKAAREVRRLVLRPRDPLDPFPAAFERIREAVLSEPSHEAWEVLDGRRVRRLLRREARALDSRRRQQVLRLGTVFLPA